MIDYNNFAQEWIAAWNAHDIEAVLSHYTDDFILSTPMAMKIVPESNGIVSGKAAVHSYWSQALKRIPDLHFRLIKVLTGINGLVIYYTNTATGKTSAEVLQLNQAGKVEKAFVFYENL
ncbi:nuclear transport factor 2 family protein [Taibaiella soli]|uniref:Nuclear transport factor 2 family protein n=1 Tax=Taibaiella soli TaxID=1649169 RepID=A0A2W2A6M1_9BACT|nr:nuclear transport factor 2 family protein [Taibaiella soli]PZF70925.1 nuclear transport factor 2 family protein [Taibaiella soli]